MTTPDPHDSFTVPEEEVARRTGLAIDEVRQRRGTLGTDFAQKGRGHRYWWTERAVETLAASLEKPAVESENSPAVLTPAAEQSAAATQFLPGARHPVSVRLTRTTFPNTRIVMGMVEGSGEAQTVTVVVGPGRSRLFVPGMMVLARQRVGSVYDFEGNPACPEKGRVWPRLRGRW